MSFIGGYQSDVNLNDLNFIGDFPADHNIGGYGQASGIANNYVMNLIPGIASYRVGMLIAVLFLQINTGATTLNINSKGLKAVKKIFAGNLIDLEAGDLAPDKIYLLVYDGSSFQIANSSFILFDATEQRKGIAQIASDADIITGIDNTKFITPVKLLAYIAGKVTGLWKNKGVLDCSANPFYPEGIEGDAYTVSVAGKIGGIDGVNVQVRDVIYCTSTNAGGSQFGVGGDWNIVQANLEQATEILAGFARLATFTEALAGTDAQTIITPATLHAVIQSLSLGGSAPFPASEEIAGILRIATLTDVNAETDDLKAITSLKLAQYVSGKITGLWKDKGVIDCSTNPNYPVAKKGDAYTVNVAGHIGGIDGIVVEVRDVIYCNTDNPGGSQTLVGASWNVIQANLVQATEILAGFARLATLTEALAGTDAQTIITPATLHAVIQSLSLGGSAPSPASEEIAGILRIATLTDLNGETDDLKAITSLKLAQYVSGKITGLWKDKGVLNCSADPNYPIGKKGDAYTVNVGGHIGGIDGIVVEVRDVIYCNNDNPGGSQALVGASWNVIQANLVQATEILAGFARLATPTEALTGTDAQTIITPATLHAVIQSLSLVGSPPPNANEEIAGILEIATQPEVDAGTDNARAVTPLKLAQYVAARITGLWKNKGLIDCSPNPNYPPGIKGDAYTVSNAGTIGGIGGITVEIRDVIYCNADNAGGLQGAVGASWNIIQANLVQATELIAGYAKIAPQTIVDAGLDDSMFVTALKLKTLLNNRIKPMRTQIRFYSDSLTEINVNAGIPADYSNAPITVSALPATAIIRQVVLIWEGTIRNTDSPDNTFASGNIALSKDGIIYNPLQGINDIILLDRTQISFFRFVVKDATHVFVGNGTYLAKFSDLSCLYPNLIVSGHWILEIDYETP